MKNKLVLSAIFITLFLPTSFSFAQNQGSEMGDGGKGNMMAGNHNMPMMSPEIHLLENPSLNLSTEQKEKIKKIFDESKPEMQQKEKDLWEKMKIFKDAYIDDKKTESDLIKDHDEVEAAHNKTVSLHFKNRMQVRSVLTSEQRKQFFDSMRDNMRKNKPKNGD
jgi:Spy/CpxP family protein refolding chaperone